MNPHRASVTVPLPQAELFAWLCSVENWPKFLEGLEGVEPLGYRRYRWSVHYAGRRRTTDVVVSVDARQHRLSWRHLHRPAFDGTLRLTALSLTRTQVELVLDIEPTGLVEGLVESVGMTGWMAQRDLQRLRDLVVEGDLRSLETG